MPARRGCNPRKLGETPDLREEGAEENIRSCEKLINRRL